MRVIVNADDFGHSPVVNQEIVALLGEGRLTSATLMAGGSAFAEAASHARAFPACSFGVHLTLTELPPLTSGAAFAAAGLLDDGGRFVDQTALRRVRPSAALRDAIFAEWSAQIAAALDHGIAVSHLDSHHHVHTLPWLFSTLKRVQRRFAIRRVRPSMNWYYRPESQPSLALRLKKRLWNAALRRWYPTRTVDHFTSLDWFVRNMTGGEVRSSGTVELMVHPGHPDYRAESALLRQPWSERLPSAITLISYHAL